MEPAEETLHEVENHTTRTLTRPTCLTRICLHGMTYLSTWSGKSCFIFMVERPYYILWVDVVRIVVQLNYEQLNYRNAFQYTEIRWTISSFDVSNVAYRCVVR